jgi:hypothetical protein
LSSCFLNKINNLRRNLWSVTGAAARLMIAMWNVDESSDGTVQRNE